MIYVHEINCVLDNYISRLQFSFAQSSTYPLKPLHSHAETLQTARGRVAERESTSWGELYFSSDVHICMRECHQLLPYTHQRNFTSKEVEDKFHN